MIKNFSVISSSLVLLKAFEGELIKLGWALQKTDAHLNARDGIYCNAAVKGTALKQNHFWYKCSVGEKYTLPQDWDTALKNAVIEPVFKYAVCRESNVSAWTVGKAYPLETKQTDLPAYIDLRCNEGKLRNVSSWNYYGHNYNTFDLYTEEDYLKLNTFNPGDYITITCDEKTRNCNDEMQLLNGALKQITRVAGHKVIFSGSSPWTWRFSDGHFRKATPEEIKIAFTPLMMQKGSGPNLIDINGEAAIMYNSKGLTLSNKYTWVIKDNILIPKIK